MTNTPKNLSRRDMLKLGGLSLGSLTIACAGGFAAEHYSDGQLPERKHLEHLVSSYDGTNSVQGFLDSFPRTIPGAARIDINHATGTPYVNHCLVHIRNFHRRRDTTDTTNTLARIAAVQDDVESILSYFIGHNDFLPDLKVGVSYVVAA